MTTSVTRDGSTFADAAPQLLDSLFYAVSHDLRSPLLTVSLSAQLLEHSLEGAEDSGAHEALGGLRAACDDLERMLAAMNALSRASRRKAEPTGVALEKLCAGAPDATVALDETTAAELQAAVPPGALSSVEASAATIAWPVAGLDGSPLMALTGSLSAYAGGPVEALACLEIALARHHGTLQVSAGHVEVRIPLVTADEHE